MEIGFIVKKIIGFWILPLSICVLLLTAGLLILCLNKTKPFSRFQTLGKSLSVSGLVLLILFSWNPISTELLRPIEQSFQSFNTETQVEYVVVLGNQVTSDESTPITSHLSSSATARLLEGIRIAKAQPDIKMIVSGYAGDNSKSCAEVYADVAILLGISADRIIQLREPKDTKEEAIAVKKIVGDSQIALVTSASHMPRAHQYFTDQAVAVHAAPTFYLAKKSDEIDLRFNAQGLLKTERAIHEWLGFIWLRMTN